MITAAIVCIVVALIVVSTVVPPTRRIRSVELARRREEELDQAFTAGALWGAERLGRQLRGQELRSGPTPNQLASLIATGRLQAWMDEVLGGPSQLAGGGEDFPRPRLVRASDKQAPRRLGARGHGTGGHSSHAE